MKFWNLVSSLIALVPDKRLGVFLAASRRDGSYLVDKLQNLLKQLVIEKPRGQMQRTTASNAGWPERARKINGEYYILRFSQNSMETLAKWQTWIRVKVLGPLLRRSQRAFVIGSDLSRSTGDDRPEQRKASRGDDR